VLATRAGTVCLERAGGVDLRLSSVELPPECCLAGFFAYVEVILAGEEGGQQQG
jgi:hypothetical protein